MEKPAIAVLSKLDLPQARDTFEKLRHEIAGLRGISAATGDGVQELIYEAWRTIGTAPAPQLDLPETRIHLRPAQGFAIRKERGAFVLSGERIERLAAMTDFDSDEGFARFEQILGKLGVERKLREMGAVEGDTVRIGSFEFTYS